MKSAKQATLAQRRGRRALMIILSCFPPKKRMDNKVGALRPGVALKHTNDCKSTGKMAVQRKIRKRTANLSSHKRQGQYSATRKNTGRPARLPRQFPSQRPMTTAPHSTRQTRISSPVLLIFKVKRLWRQPSPKVKQRICQDLTQRNLLILMFFLTNTILGKHDMNGFPYVDDREKPDMARK
jgi:hypothetical protein